LVGTKIFRNAKSFRGACQRHQSCFRSHYIHPTLQLQKDVFKLWIILIFLNEKQVERIFTESNLKKPVKRSDSIAKYSTVLIPVREKLKGL